jgi:hypothetical protein
MPVHAIGTMLLLLALLAVTGCENSGLDSHPVRPGTASTTPLQESAPPVQQAAHKDTAPLLKEVAHKIQPGHPSSLVPPKRESRETTLTSARVNDAPVIDGRAGESFWNTAPAITTLDYSSQRPITIRSVHTAGEIFFLVTFPAETPSETHKTWVWDAKEEIYREGPDREDVFVFKWSMSGNSVDLRLRDAEPHRGDIWFWKAVRTNPSGYADDKWQSVSATPGPDSRKISSPSPGQLHFLRQGDTGKPAWDEKFFFEYQGATLTKYAASQPDGSRADVRAKGVWSNKQWTIEFGRKLNTGHDDDVVFKPGAAHLFGVACHAMAYDTPHEKWSQPLYRTGDVFDRLLLTLPSRAQK